jgi:hypothetical protein
VDKNEGIISSCLEVHDGSALEVTWGLLKQLMRFSIIYCYIMFWLSVYRIFSWVVLWLDEIAVFKNA